ncbi:hypothetical protein Bpfe_028545 [Biomphalaria pfeifferi]|uniref:Ig-like domain-containing protein n=1 Tax=Biomphalaria pfeifferi TaxID=112525 RepID=A0AAD8EWV8_BIOPF|nr:hypothetical protein Bpfe_028545 [Biomphalaria pfeifferi]
MTLYAMLLSFSIMFYEVNSSVISPCPAACVGESYRLHCHGRTNSKGSVILWNRKDKENRSTEDVSRCYLNSTCSTQSTSQFYVNTTSSYNVHLSYTFDSVLTISNVTQNDRDAVISCGVIYETSPLSEPDVALACRLPVFDFTLPPSCRATLVMPDVSIVCDFHKVHPKVKCEFGYEKNVFHSEVPVDYVVNPLTPALSDYYNITCNGKLKFKSSYQQSYFMRFIPIYELGIKEAVDKDQKRVQEVTLVLSPQVVINSPPYISICPPKLTRNVTIFCSATSSSPSVMLILFVDNVKVMPQKPPTQILSQLYITMQEYTLQVDKHFRNKSLVCQRKGLFNGTAKIVLAIPPISNPMFVSEEGKIINHITVNPDDFNISIKCLVNDGVPLVSNISVVCYFVNRTWQRDVHNSSHFVVFTANGKSIPFGSNCICSAHHVSGCYTKKASLIISVNGTYDNYAQSEEKRHFTVTLSIVLALFVLILVPVIIAMSVFFCRNRDAISYYQEHYIKKNYDVFSDAIESENYTNITETSLNRRRSLPVNDSESFGNVYRNLNTYENMYLSNLSISSIATMYSPPLPQRTKLCSGKDLNVVSENSEDIYREPPKHSSEENVTEMPKIEDNKSGIRLEENVLVTPEEISLQTLTKTNSSVEKDVDDGRSNHFISNHKNNKYSLNNSFFDCPSSPAQDTYKEMCLCCETKFDFENSETYYSDEQKSISEKKKKKKRRTLRRDTRFGVRKRDYMLTSSVEMLSNKKRELFLTSSEETLAQNFNNSRRRCQTLPEEMLAQTFKKCRSNRKKDFYIRHCSHRGQKQRSEKRPATQTLSLENSSLSSFPSHSGRCHACKAETNNYSETSAIRNYSNYAPSKKQILAEKTGRSVVYTFNTRSEDVACRALDRSEAVGENAFDDTLRYSKKTMLSGDKNFERTDRRVISPAPMKGDRLKSSGERTFNLGKGTELRHKDGNMSEDLSDKDTGSEAEGPGVVYLINTINPSSEDGF